ncbi:MAG: hypothetical protein COA94_08865 [Rickettsiales bacterium]|nr:MAG: hypothetical protein COA94_08865 [Rickettsiales bacterium]
MRTLCVLIGFDYKNTKKNLVCIFIDLYIAYTSLKNMGHKKIMIITDIVETPDILLLKNAIFDGLVGGNILSFMSEIRNKGKYIKYTGSISLKHLIMSLVKLNNQEKMLLYYTGHGENNSITLPTKFDVLSMNDIKDIIEESTKINKAIILMDCCFGSINLPYTLRGKTYRLSTNDMKFSKKKILCISSTTKCGTSLMTNTGSVFTKSLFENIALSDVVEITNRINTEIWTKSNSKQKVTVYSSHPNIKNITQILELGPN